MKATKVCPCSIVKFSLTQKCKTKQFHLGKRTRTVRVRIREKASNRDKGNSLVVGRVEQSAHDLIKDFELGGSRCTESCEQQIAHSAKTLTYNMKLIFSVVTCFFIVGSFGLIPSGLPKRSNTVQVHSSHGIITGLSKFFGVVTVASTMSAGAFDALAFETYRGFGKCYHDR